MLGIYFALAAALAQSAQAAINKKLLEKIPSRFLLLSVFGTAAILVSPLAIYSGIPRLDAAFFIAGFSGALLNVLATLSLWEALKRDNVSRMFPFLTLAPLFSILTSALVLGEFPSRQGLLGITLIVAGLFIIESRREISNPLAAPRTRSGFIFVILAAFLLSLNIAVDRFAILHSSPLFYPPFFLGAAFVPVFLYTLLRPPAVSSRILVKHSRILLISSLCLAAGTILTSLALSLALASYVSSIKRLGILFAMLWGAKFLKEEVSMRLITGALLATAGAILIALAH